jgi:hypothetical protein
LRCAALRYMVSGAIAGVAEHCVMFPVDTIKTHMQVAKSKETSLVQTVRYKASPRSVGLAWVPCVGALLGCLAWARLGWVLCHGPGLPLTRSVRPQVHHADRGCECYVPRCWRTVYRLWPGPRILL